MDLDQQEVKGVTNVHLTAELQAKVDSIARDMDLCKVFLGVLCFWITLISARALLLGLL
jgi:hypothetical protein